MNTKKKTNSSNSKMTITIVVVMVCAAIVFGVKYFKDNNNLSKRKISLAKTKGNENAPIKITEFIDLQCPACAFGSKFLKKFMQENPDKIFLQLKHYPLPMHSHGRIVARYSECAARQDKFWPFVDLVLERQDQWKILFDAHSAFDAIAKEIELNKSALESCLHDPKVDEQVEQNREEGKTLGVQSTPSYFVNDVMVVGTKNLELEINKLISAQTK